MFLLLIVVALGGILTAWGIDRCASNRAPVSIVRSFPFWFAVLFGIALIVRVAVDSIFQPPAVSDNSIALLNYGCFILSFASLSLLLLSICRAPSVQQGSAAIIIGLVIVIVAAIPLFHPGFFYPIFRSIFVITPSELIACVLFFLLGMSFVFAQSFWRTIWDHLADTIPDYPLAAGIVLSILFVSALLLATMPASLSSWMSRINGIKTPFFEAQFSTSVKTVQKSIPASHSSAWPYELFGPEEIDYYIGALKFHEKIRRNHQCSLVKSLNELDGYLKRSGYYNFLSKIDAGSAVRPPLQEIKNSAALWAMQLKDQQDACDEKRKCSAKAKSQPQCLTENPLFFVLLANLFQISEDFKKSELALEEGIEKFNSPLEKGYLNSWLGYLLYMKSRDLDLERRSQEILSILQGSIADIGIIIGELSDALKRVPDDEALQNNLHYWKLYQLQTKSYFIAISVDAGLNEWSARRYASDLEAAINQDDRLKLDQPQFADLVGWTRVRFHKDLAEVREGRRVLVEAEDYANNATDDRMTKWKLANVIRYHLSHANEILSNE